MTAIEEPVTAAGGEQRVDEIRSATRAITSQFDRSYWLRCEEGDRQPVELTSALGESGLLGIGVPEVNGGQGGGLYEQAVFVEELARSGIPSYSFLVANFTRNLVLRYGTPAQVSRFVSRTLTGLEQTCFGLTEADAGTNAFAMRTRAGRVADGWKINGQKVFISAAGEASQMMLVARTSAANPQDRTRGLSVFAFNLPVAGINFDRQRIKTLAPEHQYIVTLEDVIVPADALIGEAGEGGRYMFYGLNSERILTAAMAVGLGFFAVDKAAKYVIDRRPFGDPIGSYQAVSHPLAAAFLRLEGARLAVWEAARATDRNEPAGIKANSAKWLGTEAACHAVDAAIQAHGGYAFDRDYDMISLYEPVRLLRIAPINNENVLSYIAERALGLPRSR
jgi:acyl-CoA dehydrogenase